MWSRAELKEKAKAVLKTNYWEALLVSIVIALAGGSNSGGGGGGSGGSGSTSDYSGTNSSLFSGDGIFSNWGVILLIVLVVVVLLILAFRVFVGYSLEVGGRRYFIKSAQYEDNKKCFRFAFQGETYLGIVSTMFRRAVQNFLWYLALIVPGIIKRYAYRMVPYILADNPNIGSKRAIELSIEMTNGHKMNMFVLDLSFIGWYLLGLLACCVGMVFVLPYENATNAELYLVLRKNALDTGMCRYDELMLNYQRPDDGIGLL
ncbi:DUF975 family protein [Acetivibrio cellulolyticus]|uniref:DUF975 family protein n=1 Tax=Acetivibrio cellulolyticus TaxID=35830 RepID=UPI0001E2F572|nr:DUF975 family protein [Acetivibrio cellulolyticus]